MRYLWFTSLFSLLLSAHVAYGQNFDQGIIGTIGNDRGQIYQMRDRLVIVGETNQNGSQDILISVLDLQLNEIWTRTIDGGADEKGIAVASGSNGNLLVSGSGSSSLMIELDPGGQILNSWKLGSDQDRLHHIIAISDGFLVYGELLGLVGENEKAAILKYDGSMEAKWRHCYDYIVSPDYNSGFEMKVARVVESSNSFMILGTYYEMDAPSGRAMIRLVKVNERGYLQWVTGFDGGGEDEAVDMVGLADGGFMILANSSSYSAGGDSDLVLIRTDAIGNAIWQKVFKTAGEEKGGAVKELENGDFAFCASSTAPGLGKEDVVLVITDADGNLKSVHAYGGAGDDLAEGLLILDNVLLISGYTESFGDNEEVYVIRSDFSGNSGECGFDVTDLFTEESVVSTVFEGNYAHSIFPLPELNPVDIQPVVLAEEPVCFHCQAGSSETRALCEDQVITLDREDPAVVSYVWQDGSNESSLEVAEPGIYWVDIETGLCQFRDTINVSLVRLEDLNIHEEREICKGEKVVLDAFINSALSYHWQDGSSEAELEITEPGFYRVEVSTPCGVISDSAELILPRFEYSIPNVFTPNGDGFNDRFEIRSQSTNPQALKIFSRSGEVVFQSESYVNSWDGDQFASGVYYYVFEDMCTQELFRGWLQIIR